MCSEGSNVLFLMAAMMSCHQLLVTTWRLLLVELLLLLLCVASAAAAAATAAACCFVLPGCPPPGVGLSAEPEGGHSAEGQRPEVRAAAAEMATAAPAAAATTGTASNDIFSTTRARVTLAPSCMQIFMSSSSSSNFCRSFPRSASAAGVYRFSQQNLHCSTQQWPQLPHQPDPGPTAGRHQQAAGTDV